MKQLNLSQIISAEKEGVIMAAIDLWRGNKSPFRELSRMRSVLDRMFDDFPRWASRISEDGISFSPTCEVSEDNKNYYLTFDLPGVPKGQVKIDLVDNQLTVSAERREEKKKEEKKTRMSEVSYGSYSRTLTLPAHIDEKKVDAKFENGVLTVTVPKTEATNVKHIAVS